MFVEKINKIRGGGIHFNNGILSERRERCLISNLPFFMESNHE